MVKARAVTASASSNIRPGMDLLDTPVLNKRASSPAGGPVFITLSLAREKSPQANISR